MGVNAIFKFWEEREAASANKKKVENSLGRKDKNRDISTPESRENAESKCRGSRTETGESRNDRPSSCTNHTVLLHNTEQNNIPQQWLSATDLKDRKPVDERFSFWGVYLALFLLVPVIVGIVLTGYVMMPSPPPPPTHAQIIVNAGMDFLIRSLYFFV